MDKYSFEQVDNYGNAILGLERAYQHAVIEFRALRERASGCLEPGVVDEPIKEIDILKEESRIGKYLVDSLKKSFEYMPVELRQSRAFKDISGKVADLLCLEFLHDGSKKAIS